MNINSSNHRILEYLFNYLKNDYNVFFKFKNIDIDTFTLLGEPLCEYHKYCSTEYNEVICDLTFGFFIFYK